jgi:2-oxoisovalerate dehydrogenase E1 component beta subunit
LLIAAIEDPDPVIFLEPKRLYNGPFDGHHDRPVTPWSNHELGEVPDGHYVVPLGTSAIRREGAALTILAYATMVHVAMTAAAETGVDAEIIDLRTLVPLDLDAIQASVRKTGRCVIVHEAPRTAGFGAEIAARLAEHAMYDLVAPVERVTGYDTHIPLYRLEIKYMPGVERIVAAAKRTLAAS